MFGRKKIYFRLLPYAILWLNLSSAFAQEEGTDLNEETLDIENLSNSDEWDEFDGDDVSSAGINISEEVISASEYITLHGLIEAAAASRFLSDPNANNDFLLAESRARLVIQAESGFAKGGLKVDFVGDAVRGGIDIDLRGAWADINLGPIHLRAGRQVLTWGTGDFVFLNDLFPKDFQSFFIGRADEFLKAPSDAVKLSFYSGSMGIDLVWVPVFAPDRFINGERLSFFFFSDGRTIGPSASITPLSVREPSKELENSEGALRVFGKISGWELAGYGYIGFFKQPLSLEPTTLTLTYSRLTVYGASIRGTIGGGIFYSEGAFYYSLDDTQGTNPFTPNSQLRGLVGYEFEPWSMFTIGLQYYAEWTLQHDELISNSPLPLFEPDEVRHLATLRLTYRALSENLELSAFTFVSPSDMDTHIRLRVTYKLAEPLRIVVGANIMTGEKDFTFFGQLTDNSSGFARVRYNF